MSRQRAKTLVSGESGASKGWKHRHGWFTDPGSDADRWHLTFWQENHFYSNWMISAFALGWFFHLPSYVFKGIALLRARATPLWATWLIIVSVPATIWNILFMFLPAASVCYVL